MALRRPVVLLAAATLTALAFLLGAHACHDDQGPRPRTILLLTIDTLRRDAVQAFAGLATTGLNAPAKPSATPRMDALARSGQLFVDARTPVPLTLPAHTVMLSGLPPAATGVRLNAYERLPGPEARGFPLLAERLREAGWRTGAFVSSQPLAARYGLDQGFEVYDDGHETLAPVSTGAVPERPGAETCARALAFLRAAGAEAQVFLWVHLFEPHAPYTRYVDGVAEADAVVGTLLDGLLLAGRSRDAAILLTSDHGEMLGDLGERTHGLLLGDAVLRVPFALYLPGGTPHLRRDPVDLADVAPTLAGLAGVEWPSDRGPFAGRDLGADPPPDDRVRVAESLYAHHLYRWAQVVAAHGPTGTLVDTGGTRLGWLEPGPAGEPQRAWREAVAPPQALGDAIAAYRAGEQRSRMGPTGPTGPYEGSGAVSPFLGDADNGRLLDPYREVPRVSVLHQLKFQILSAPEAGGLPARARRELLEQTQHQVNLDPANPEVHFLQGLLFEFLSTYKLPGIDPDEALAYGTQAESAYGRAFELGRQDGETLVRWAGVTAKGREAQALERLRIWEPRLPPNCQVLVLMAKLYTTLGQTSEAAEVCARARDLCRTPRQHARMTEACR